MPICPLCHMHIHEGAKKQCPACSYSLNDADERLGKGLVEFPRILDDAGVFSHDERCELMAFLEKLEKRLAPVALGIYLTDRGKREELSVHAHWMLNHLKIHHASFGKRGYKRAIEENPLEICIGGSQSAEQECDVPSLHDLLKRPQRENRLLHSLREAWQYLFAPSELPPVEREWMLILVLDVQLGRACFTWGYKLDTYVHPEELSACIVAAQGRFRNKAVMGGLKKVMERAVSQLAKRAIDINAQYHQFKKKKTSLQQEEETRLPETPMPKDAGKKAMMLFLCFSLILFSQSAMGAVQQNPSTKVSSEWNIDDAPSHLDVLTNLSTSLDLNDVTPSEAKSLSTSPSKQLPQPQPAYCGQAASEQYAPTIGTQEEASGVICSRALLANALPSSLPSGDEEGELQAVEVKNDVVRDPWQTVAPAQSGAMLYDDECVLGDLERDDISRYLNQCNVHKKYRIYVSLVDARRGQAPLYGAAAFLPLIAEMGEPCILLQYSVGVRPALDVSMSGLNLSEEEKLEWVQQLCAVAEPYSNARDALLIAVKQAMHLLDVQTPHLRKGQADDTLYLQKVTLGLSAAEAQAKAENEQQQKKAFDQERLVEDVEPFLPFAWLIMSCVLTIAAYFYLRYRSQRRAILLSMPDDYRLSSPSGAGVSPVVSYKEKKP